MPWAEKNDVIRDAQFGFGPLHSTVNVGAILPFKQLLTNIFRKNVDYIAAS